MKPFLDIETIQTVDIHHQKNPHKNMVDIEINITSFARGECDRNFIYAIIKITIVVDG